MSRDFWFVAVRCYGPAHRDERKIASFSKGLTSVDGIPVWSEIEAYSKDRRIEQKRKQAEVEALGPMPENPSLDDWLKWGGIAGDKVTSQHIVDGRPETLDRRMARHARAKMGLDLDASGRWTPRQEPAEWTTHDLTCRRCRAKRQHVTARYREDNLHAMLDWLVDLHPERHHITVTPRILNEIWQKVTR